MRDLIKLVSTAGTTRWCASTSNTKKLKSSKRSALTDSKETGASRFFCARRIALVSGFNIASSQV